MHGPIYVETKPKRKFVYDLADADDLKHLIDFLVSNKIRHGFDAYHLYIKDEQFDWMDKVAYRLRKFVKVTNDQLQKFETGRYSNELIQTNHETVSGVAIFIDWPGTFGQIKTYKIAEWLSANCIPYRIKWLSYKDYFVPFSDEYILLDHPLPAPSVVLAEHWIVKIGDTVELLRDSDFHEKYRIVSFWERLWHGHRT